MSSPELRGCWLSLLPSGEAAFDDLVARYAEPHRRYHTLDHVRDVLDSLVDAGPALLFAAWFHDAVYDPRASDNEEQSAELMRRVLAANGVAPDVLEETARLILLTKTHTAELCDWDGYELLDADLAILGASEAEYDAYAAAIRAEYDWVPEEAYRAGRATVLRRFLERRRIYRRTWEREEAARRNLVREIASLTTRRA
jgi:predicted metal-dependent HD superfamily phosphohydrolase